MLDAFVRDGRITSLPAALSKPAVRRSTGWPRTSSRAVATTRRPRVTRPERRYSDVVTLRRYLVDEELLDRDAGEYWRMGGTVG